MTQPPIIDAALSGAEFQDVADWLKSPLPAIVERKARLLLLDSLGCIAAGLRHAEVERFAQTLSVAFPGTVAVPGSGATLSPSGVAALAATAMCWDEANEGLAASHGRPGLSVIPCVLALARNRPMSDVVQALALGYEIGARAGQLWRIKPGMHVDGSWHALGAAAACALLMGADPITAVRLAACQVPFSLYRPITAGMNGRNTYPAHAALLGMLSAAAAAAGMEAPAGTLAEARGLALGLTEEGVRSPVGHWLLLDAYIKPYAGVRHGHYAVAAAASLRLTGTDAVRGITLHTYAEALRYAGNRAPKAPISAQFSLSFAVAAGLLWGDLSPDAYRMLDDPELRRLEQLVVLQEDASLPGRAARITVDLGNETRAATVTSVPGDAETPMTEAEIVAKCARLTAHVPGAERWPDIILNGNTFSL